MSEIRVECYSGQRADERPLRFALRGRQFLVSEIDGRWYSPDASYFRVLADDGNYYVLRHDEGQDMWALDGFRAGGLVRPEDGHEASKRFGHVTPESRAQLLRFGGVSME